LFNSLIEYHHYLGYCHPVGEQLKYIIFAGKRPIACFTWSSAPTPYRLSGQIYRLGKRCSRKASALYGLQQQISHFALGSHSPFGVSFVGPDNPDSF